MHNYFSTTHATLHTRSLWKSTKAARRKKTRLFVSDTNTCLSSGAMKKSWKAGARLNRHQCIARRNLIRSHRSQTLNTCTLAMYSMSVNVQPLAATVRAFKPSSHIFCISQLHLSNVLHCHHQRHSKGSRQVLGSNVQ